MSIHGIYEFFKLVYNYHIKYIKTSYAAKFDFIPQVNYLGTIGGENVKQCVRRTMKGVFTNDMAIKFNWKGKGDKRPFSSLELSSVVKGNFNVSL